MNKRKIALLVFSLMLCLNVLSACSQTNDSQVPPDTKEELTQKDFIIQKVTYYTQQNFRFIENVTVDNQDNKYQITLTFIPEVGSVPIKEDIYREMAEYAWNINHFFPEITGYEFNVLWDEHTKQNAIHAIIDEAGVKELPNRYSALMMDKKGGFEVSYRSFFSTVTESDEAEKWAGKNL
ncbi:hypothetical protein [Paenibacillus rhizophilus]|uniref:Lipoprotein n=1 Tax=Paenibacillus rhizophilus TaxID=1850366 RepID=A0A3N9Q421_9BACL|nr:hypothetical protein [Paenibacillus rhizophilus]RQW12266.1 hypothetical protein EH198_07890 [Paenibacillus rhizophilus]